jgi:hypothetical protein
MTIAPLPECPEHMEPRAHVAAAHLYRARATKGYLDRTHAARDVFAEGIAAAVELGRAVPQKQDIRGINQSNTGLGRKNSPALISDQWDSL